MEKSTSISNLAKALIKFHTTMEKIKKDAANPFFKSKYASLSNILEAINEPLIECGLSFSQFPTKDYGLITILIHGESGEYIQDDYKISPVPDYLKEKDNNGIVIWRGETYYSPQAIGSAITYARRYALAAVLGLNIEEDDDGNTATYGSRTPEQAIENDKPWLNKTLKNGTITEEWKKVAAALQNSNYSIAQVESKYKLSKAIRAELEAIVTERAKKENAYQNNNHVQNKEVSYA